MYRPGLNLDPQTIIFEVAICSPEEYLGVGRPALNHDTNKT
jgi:hypothetical protein